MEDKVLLAAVNVVVLVVVLSKLKSLFIAKQPKLNLPPGPLTLPVIGSLHHLITGPTIFRAMRSLAQKHGALMTLWFGEVPVLVVSSKEAAQEVMKTHDIMFADRLMNPTLRAFTSNGNDVVFGPYGERWRQLRKISVLELLSAARVQSFRHIREDEVAQFMKNLVASAGSAVDLTKMISRCINNTIVRESVGSSLCNKYQDEYLDALETAIQLISTPSIADLFPSSKLMQVLALGPRKALECRNRIQRIVEQLIQETTEARNRGDEVADGTRNEGFLDVLLKLQKERSTPIPLDNDTIVGVMIDMFSGGSETSSTTLTWCMTELVRNPKAMAKAQAEVREAFKGKRTVTEGDLEGLTYLKLVIKEALRLHTPGPLLVPRTCREACRVMGYDIPEGTVVFVNVWAIGRDPKYWDNPEEFKPERFENSNLDYKGTNYEFLPFGAGRRMCPGMNLGVGNIELALASLLYHFDWNLPNGIEPKDVDVREEAGISASKKTSLILHPVTRIPPCST
ncbi:unnamed protein product [Urochloa humidicola]